MRKLCKSAAGARELAFTGVCGTRGDWVWARADHQATTRGEHLVGRCWLDVGHSAGWMEFGRHQKDDLCRSASRWGNPDGWDGPRIRRGAFGHHWRPVRAGSLAGCFQAGSRWCAEGKRRGDDYRRLNTTAAFWTARAVGGGAGSAVDCLADLRGPADREPGPRVPGRPRISNLQPAAH